MSQPATVPQPTPPPQWPADQVERWEISRLAPYAKNSRTHSDAQVQQLMASIREWGWTEPVLVDEAGVLIAGHGRVMAATRLNLSHVPVVVARGWSDAQKRAYTIAHNQIPANAEWDMDLLAAELTDLKGLGVNLDLMGFDPDTLNDLLGEAGAGDQRGNLLELAQVTIAEPTHQTELGQIWQVGRHHLFITNIFEGWKAWRDYLVEGTLFVPFPGPLVTLSEAAQHSSLVMVHRDTYITGHLLDRHQERYNDNPKVIGQCQ